MKQERGKFCLAHQLVAQSVAPLMGALRMVAAKELLGFGIQARAKHFSIEKQCIETVFGAQKNCTMHGFILDLLTLSSASAAGASSI